ncbi:fungal-specific transcription factor domain-containing protein [Aspergillus karnatakaensis]|uniref:Zn(II)2Cys6 transcription factor n=1 Tax=Aspergillus karnatakaensis TaxID=1810916 RepID=UPI003CCDE22D
MTTPISRARTGCWTCRGRRIKCDEARPICRRCARLNVPCGYGVRLIWHDESIARGVCHGREAVWSKRDKHGDHLRGSPQHKHNRSKIPHGEHTARDWVFLNTSTTDLELYLNLQPLSEADTQRPFSFSPSLTTLPCVESRTQYDPALLSYFDHTICSSSTLVDDAHCNPYRYLILPMALTSPGLYHATLAIAANTLRLSNPSYRLSALEHHHQALGYLRLLLAKDVWDDVELDEMTGLVLMLCWFEISNQSSASWVTHLNGYQDLLRARQERSTQSAHSEQLTSFFNRYFAFHYVLARTAFQIDQTVFQLPDTLAPHDEDIIDPYMGFSHSLLLLINEIAEIAGSDSDSKRAKYLSEKLDSIRQTPPVESDSNTNSECVAIAEANRLGAVLLLHEVCSSPTVLKRHASTSLPTLDAESRNTCVQQILNLITEKRSIMMRTAVLPLWPLFLAGCCARDDEERVLVMQLFEELEGRRRFGNIAPAMEVVQMVWRQRDLAAQDERKRQDKSTISARFEWERAMTMMGGWKLSLT